MLRISKSYSVLVKAVHNSSQLLFRGNTLLVAQYRPSISSHLRDAPKMEMIVRKFSIAATMNSDPAYVFPRESTVWDGFGVRQMKYSVYEGNFKDGLFSGPGTITFTDGCTLSGEFKNGKIWNGAGMQKGCDSTCDGPVIEGKRNGLTKISYYDGGTFEGEMKSGKLWSGVGKLKIGRGNVFVGILQNGKYHGKGQITYRKKGNIMEGEFKFGKPWNAVLRKLAPKTKEGSVENNYRILKRWVGGCQVPVNSRAVAGAHSGPEQNLASNAPAERVVQAKRTGQAERVVQTDGTVLEGVWRGAILRGKQTSPDGKILIGDFKDGKIWNGTGEMLLKNGGVYEGEFKSGVPCGLAKVTHPDGRSQVGEFGSTGRLLQGSGSIKLPNGDIYEGEVQKGLFSGQGKLILAKSSNMLAGEFREGKLFNGTGSQRQPDGSVYKGEFKEGLPYGQGKLTYPDGRSHEGKFREGKLWSGTGTLKIKSNEVYQGAVKNGLFNGQGMLTMVSESLKGEFRDGVMWNGVSIPRDGRAMRRWVDGKLDFHTPSSSPVRMENNARESALSDVPQALYVPAEEVEPITISSTSLEELWLKVQELRGGKKEGKPITAQVAKLVMDLHYQDQDLALAIEGTSQLTFPDGRRHDTTARPSKVDRINIDTSAAELGKVKSTSKETPRAKAKNVPADKAPVVQAATKAGSGRQKVEKAPKVVRVLETHWADWHPTETQHVSVALTAEDLLATRTQRFTAADGTVYEGEWHGEMFFGKLSHPGGRVVEGEFQKEKLHGPGRITHPEGRTCEGLFIEGKLWDGRGEVSFENGDVYEGAIVKGKMHGQGKLSYPDGGSFEGEFQNGTAWNGSGMKCVLDGAMRHKLKGEFREGILWSGEGFLKYKEGGRYEGGFKDGKKHGQGKHTLPDGRIWEGEFKEGSEWTGAGVKKFADGNVYEGAMFEGKMAGQGKLTSKEGKVVEGEFKEGQLPDSSDVGTVDVSNVNEGKTEDKMHGQSKLASEEGTVVEEELREGKHPSNDASTPSAGRSQEASPVLDGPGEYVYKDGRVYRGEFKNGRPHGKGKTTCPDGRLHGGEYREGKLWTGVGFLKFTGGDSYEGEVKEGKKHGQGKYIFKDGRIWRGKFNLGRKWTGTGVKKFADGNVYEGAMFKGKMAGQGKLTLKEGKVVEGEFSEDEWRNVKAALLV